MALERVNSTPRELNFYGEGKASDIKRGFAITSLRNPKPAYDFNRGEVILAACQDDHEKVPVIVVNNIDMPLNKFPVCMLALDGFFSAQHAAHEMKTYPGYEKTMARTTLRAITFVQKEEFDKLPVNLQDKLLHADFMDVLKTKELRHLFFPTMAWHFSHIAYYKQWPEFLEDQGLISDKESSRMIEYEIGGTNLSALYNDRPEAFQKLSIDKEYPDMARPLILGIFD